MKKNKIPTELLKRRILLVKHFLKEKGIKVPKMNLSGRKSIVGAYGSISEIAQKHLSLTEIKEKYEKRQGPINENEG